MIKIYRNMRTLSVCIFGCACFAAAGSRALESERLSWPENWQGVPRNQVYISEVCVRSPADKSDWPVWVELWNNSDQEVDLSGYSLSTVQVEIHPFSQGTTLGPDQRCLVLFYKGQKPATDFEKLLPNDVETLRLFGLDIFPPIPHEDWISALSNDEINEIKATAAPGEVEQKLNTWVVWFMACTRYANEVALKSNKGALIAYAAWGGWTDICRDLSPKGKYQLTDARKEAVATGLIRDNWGDIPQVFDKMDLECAVIQLYEHGGYQQLAAPLARWTPGRPMRTDALPPELYLAKPCYLDVNADGNAGYVVFKPAITPETDSIPFERLFGWSRVQFEICHDRAMTRPVFGAELSRVYPSYDGRASIRLDPLDFFCLSGKPIYVRAVKHHADKPSVQSNVKEMVLRLESGIRRYNRTGGPWFAAPLSASVEVIQVNREYLDADRAKVAEYVKQCNRLLLEFFPQQDVNPRFDVLGAIDEVTVDFGRKPSTLMDISGLTGLPIRRLDIANSGVADISCVKLLPLTHLNLANTAVTDLAPLAGKSLQKLVLTGTAADVQQLQKCKHIDELEWLDCTPKILAELIRLDNVSLINGIPPETLRKREQEKGLEMTLTIRVLDHQGNPVPDAAVRCDISPIYGGESTRVEGNTNAEGAWTAERQPSAGVVSCRIEKDGYYTTTTSRRTVGDGPTPFVQDDKWSPWSVSFATLLKPIVNPVPMYTTVWTKLTKPTQSGSCGFDLEKGDWVAPLGDGETADLMIRISKQSGPPRWEFEFSIEVPGDKAGIQVCKSTPESGLKSAYQAPLEGYQKQYRYARYQPVGKPSDEAGLQADEYLVVRVRTKLDENGNLVEAYYGKMCDPQGMPGFPIKWYFNPDGTRNLEHAPER